MASTGSHVLVQVRSPLAPPRSPRAAPRRAARLPRPHPPPPRPPPRSSRPTATSTTRASPPSGRRAPVLRRRPSCSECGARRACGARSSRCACRAPAARRVRGERLGGRRLRPRVLRAPGWAGEDCGDCARPLRRRVHAVRLRDRRLVLRRRRRQRHLRGAHRRRAVVRAERAAAAHVAPGRGLLGGSPRRARLGGRRRRRLDRRVGAVGAARRRRLNVPLLHAVPNEKMWASLRAPGLSSSSLSIDGGGPVISGGGARGAPSVHADAWSAAVGSPSARRRSASPRAATAPPCDGDGDGAETCTLAIQLQLDRKPASDVALNGARDLRGHPRALSAADARAAVQAARRLRARDGRRGRRPCSRAPRAPRSPRTSASSRCAPSEPLARVRGGGARVPRAVDPRVRPALLAPRPLLAGAARQPPEPRREGRLEIALGVPVQRVRRAPPRHRRGRHRRLP